MHRKPRSERCSLNTYPEVYLAPGISIERPEMPCRTSATGRTCARQYQPGNTPPTPAWPCSPRAATSRCKRRVAASPGCGLNIAMAPAVNDTKADPEAQPVLLAPPPGQQRSQCGVCDLSGGYDRFVWPIMKSVFCLYGLLLLACVWRHGDIPLTDTLASLQRRQTLTRDSKAYPEFLKVSLLPRCALIVAALEKLACCILVASCLLRCSAIGAVGGNFLTVLQTASKSLLRVGWIRSSISGS